MEGPSQLSQLAFAGSMFILFSNMCGFSQCQSYEKVKAIFDDKLSSAIYNTEVSMCIVLDHGLFITVNHAFMYQSENHKGCEILPSLHV